MMANKRGYWLALLLLAGCDRAPADQEPYAGDLASCQPALVGAPVKVTPTEPRSYPAHWIMADGELVAVTSGERARGYTITALDANGAPRDAGWTVLADEPAQASLSLAAVGGVIAIAEVANETTGNHRPFCRLTLLRLKDKALVQPALRVSDATEDASIVHEAQSCLVAGTETGFVVAWQQFTSRDSDASGIFAQRVGLDAALSGERITLVERTPGKQADLAVAGDGMRALIAYRGVDQAQTSLAFVAQDSLATQPLPGVETPIKTLTAAHGGYMVRTFSSLWLLDAEGHVTHGPLALSSQSLVAPLGAAYVTIDHDEYLTAQALDSTLSRSSEPLGISEDRDAWVNAIWSTPEGANTMLVYGDGESLKLIKLGCGSTPASVGPQACPRVANLQPLDPGCQGEVCHVALRFDYLTLGVRGWSVSSGPAHPVDAAQAEAAAKAVFDANSEYLVNPLHVSGPSAGLYYVMHDPGDFGGFALVSELSGAVVAAGGIVWSGRGGYWVPDSWRPAADIQCGETPAAASSQVLDGETCVGSAGGGTTPAQAVSAALSTNLAKAVAAKGAFTARAYLYMPSVGLCAPEVAEWLVILTRQ